MHMKILAQLITLLGIPGILFKQGEKKTTKKTNPKPQKIKKIKSKIATVLAKLKYS